MLFVNLNVNGISNELVIISATREIIFTVGYSEDI